jgi:hypothetical protein
MNLELVKELTFVQWPAAKAPEGNGGLNLMVVYEDAATRRWAGEFCQRVPKRTGREAVRSTWWRLGELKEPAVLAGAVSKAIRADVILVATRAFEVFPLPFYVWVSSWLPHRYHEPGVLVALVARPASLASRSSQAPHFQYLRSVAREGRLAFMVEERTLNHKAPGLLHARTPLSGCVRPLTPNRPGMRRGGRVRQAVTL